jgi:hypothetical protein
MNKLIILNIFTMLFSSNCEMLTIQQNSIVQFNTFNNNKNQDSISIDNYQFRESITPTKTNSIFLVEMKAGKYQINTDLQYDTLIHDGKLVSNYSSNNVHVKNEYTEIKSLNFFLPDNSQKYNINIIAKFVVDKTNYDIVIKIDDKNYQFTNILSPSFTYTKSLILSPGHHHISMNVKSNNGTICSCPSKDYGYTNNNYLSVIVLNDKPIHISGYRTISVEDVLSIFGLFVLHKHGFVKHY